MAWLSFAAIMYLLLTEVLAPWVNLPALGNIGFTLVFVVFAITHCAGCCGWKRTGMFFASAAVVSYALEEIGVRSGWIYGAYHYSGMLGPKLGHVPILIPLAWFMMIYPSWVVARALTRELNLGSVAGLAASAFIAAMVMTAWDTVMDPGMSAAGNWIWENGGAYFGVPLQNYFGWLLTTFLVYLVAGRLRIGGTRAEAARGFPALPILVYALYAVAYVVPRPRAALQIVALFAMGMPALLAVIHVWLAPKAPCFDSPAFNAPGEA